MKVTSALCFNDDKTFKNISGIENIEHEKIRDLYPYQHIIVQDEQTGIYYFITKQNGLHQFRAENPADLEGFNLDGLYIHYCGFVRDKKVPEVFLINKDGDGKLFFLCNKEV